MNEFQVIIYEKKTPDMKIKKTKVYVGYDEKEAKKIFKNQKNNYLKYNQLYAVEIYLNNIIYDCDDKITIKISEYKSNEFENLLIENEGKN